MSTNIRVDINRNVGLSMALAVSGGFLAGYYVSRILSTSSKSVLPDASSEMDSPHTNGSINSDAQRSDAAYAQKDNSGNGCLDGGDEETLVLALLVRLDLQLVRIPSMIYFLKPVWILVNNLQGTMPF